MVLEDGSDGMSLQEALGDGLRARLKHSGNTVVVAIRSCGARVLATMCCNWPQLLQAQCTVMLHTSVPTPSFTITIDESFAIINTTTIINFNRFIITIFITVASILLF